MKFRNTLKKAGNLLENKAVIITVTVLNCIILSSLAGYLFFLKGKGDDTDSINPVPEERQMDYSGKDSEMASIYVSLLEGTEFDIGDGIVFSFGSEGRYAGFFDANHKNVKDYRYKICMEKDNVLLQICNKEETQLVSYNMIFDKDGNVVLKHSNMEKTIKLEF